MKHLLLICFFAISHLTGFTQKPSITQLQQTAKTYLQQGDYENSILYLKRAIQQEPDNVELLKDLCFACYLKRDYATAIETGKQLIEKTGADQQSFQVLGLSYKAIAAYKDCGKLYQTALKKFPNSGVIYNEYAELTALENNLAEAIVLWEKGIELDPNYSSNYYHATMFYMRSENWIRAILYGEIFLNLESYSARTEEIKTRLYEAYKNGVTPSALEQQINNKKSSAFEKTILVLFKKTVSDLKNELTIETLLSLRTRFVIEWLQGNQQTYPFRLFEHQQYLLNQGIFEAYNYWLFSTSIDPDVNRIWQNTHTKESGGFKAFQQSRVFKVPAAQYYFSR